MHIQCCTVPYYVLLLHICSNYTGGWSEEGVFLDVESTNSTSITCVTKHLTSFAVLVDSSGTIGVSNNIECNIMHCCTDKFAIVVDILAIRNLLITFISNYVYLGSMYF